MTFAYANWHPGSAEPAPTVVALHGHGAHAQDLLGLAPFLAEGRVMMLCPQAEFPLAPGAFTWFHREGEAQRTVEEFERVASALREFIEEAVPRCGGDLARTVVLGFSQGGTLAYRLGLGEPRRFAGVAALSTYFPEDIAATVDREAAAELPLLVQHGTHDQMITVQRAQASRDLLQTIGAQPHYLEYPMQHEIGRQSLTDLSEWLKRVLKLEGPGSAV
ncbi:MAG: dienelactone hydrolase family protein [Chloroflexi bacterium]|nr:dienelactone hydrolase family protein [Chloroflexota bacterium]